jgi:hypothetical protein
MFKSDDNVQEAKIQQFRQQPKECFADWYTNLSINGTPACTPVVVFSHSVVPSPITGKKVEFFLSAP